MTEKLALTRRDLDQMGCMTPGCTSPHGLVFFHARCHTGAATEVKYEAGELTVACARCKKVVAVVAVAAG